MSFRAIAGFPAAAIVLAVALSGCAGSGGDADLRNVRRDEAANVPPVDPKGDLLAFLRSYLNDPTRIREAAISEPMLKPVGPVQRYVVCVSYNARDLAGKYTGARDRLAVFVAGKLDQLVEQPRELCTGAEHKPFPELERLAR